MTFAVLLAVALSAAPDAEVAPTFSWDVPGALEAVPVGQRIEVNGLPMAIFLVHSSWELDRLLLHYAGRFAEAGYFIPPRMGRITGLKLPRVVALDDRRLISFLVYGWPEADGSTTLVLGSADLGHRRAAPAGGLPIFPGASHVLASNLEGAKTIGFEARASRDEVIDFYRSVLPSGGWAEREPGLFVKDGRALQVLARVRKGSEVLNVVLLEQSDLDARQLPAP